MVEAAPWACRHCVDCWDCNMRCLPLQPPSSYLEVVVVVVLSSSGGMQPNFVAAQGTGEGPCSQDQMGTFLQQLVDRGRPCCQQQQQQGEAPGRSHFAAAVVVGKDSLEQQVEVGRSHSSCQVKGNHKQQHHSAQEQHEKHLWPV